MGALALYGLVGRRNQADSHFEPVQARDIQVAAELGEGRAGGLDEHLVARQPRHTSRMSRGQRFKSAQAHQC